MPNKLYINSNDFTDSAYGLDKVKVEYSEKEDGAIDIGQSSQIVLTGAGYQYVKSLLFDDACSSIDKSFEVRIFIEKCRKSILFDLKNQGVSFDVYNCKCKLNLNTKNDKEEAFEILNRTYFWNKDEGYLDTNPLVKMITVYEPGILGRVVAFIYVEIILRLANILLDIYDVVDSITFDSLPDTDPLKEALDESATDALGGGEYNTHANLNSIFKYWAVKAGLTFKSSIFHSNKYGFDYGKTILFSQIANSGYSIKTHKTGHVNFDNLPNKTPVQLLNDIKPVFNAQWKLIGDNLIFERKDYFDGIRKKVFNLSEELAKNNIQGEWEFTYDNKDNKARFLGAFSNDTADQQGNKALPLYRHNEEWNEGRKHKNRKGDQKPDIPFGGLRCTEDFDRSGFLSGEWEDLKPSHKHSIVLSDETASLPKLIMADHRDTIYQGTHFVTTYREQLPTNPNRKPGKPDLSGDWEYNRPFWMSTLYEKFHYIDDPDLKNHRFIEIEKLTWKPDDFCAAEEFMTENKLNTYIETKYGKGNISKFAVNYENCTIEFSNITFKCDGFN